MKTSVDLKRFKKSITHHFLLRTLHILEGGTVFLLSSAVIASMMYILGNFQSFMEETQLFILSMIQTVSIVGFVVSLYYLAFLVYWIFRRKRVPFQRLFSALFAIVINILLSAGSLLIQDLSTGLG